MLSHYLQIVYPFLWVTPENWAVAVWSLKSPNNLFSLSLSLSFLLSFCIYLLQDGRIVSIWWNQTSLISIEPSESVFYFSLTLIFTLGNYEFFSPNYFELNLDMLPICKYMIHFYKVHWKQILYLTMHLSCTYLIHEVIHL